jgi:nucleotide-binding universal stress UspA family protein
MNAGFNKALKYTLEHIIRPGDTLHLLHVLPSSSSLIAAQGQSLASMMPPEEGEQEQMAARARQYFEQHYMQAAQEAGARVQLDLVHGLCNRSVSALICERVNDLAAALVVLSVQRRRSFIEELFQPPVSHQVAQHCPRPTLILHDAC